MYRRVLLLALAAANSLLEAQCPEVPDALGDADVFLADDGGGNTMS